MFRSGSNRLDLRLTSHNEYLLSVPEPKAAGSIDSADTLRLKGHSRHSLLQSLNATKIHSPTNRRQRTMTVCRDSGLLEPSGEPKPPIGSIVTSNIKLGGIGYRQR